MMIRQFHSIQVLSSAVSTMTQIQRRLLVTRELRSVKPPLDRSTLPSYQFIGSSRFQCDRMVHRNRHTVSIVTKKTTIVVPNNHHNTRPFSTTATSPSKNNHMGLFRLLTDVQRTILIEQQQLTAQVVRKRIESNRTSDAYIIMLSLFPLSNVSYFFILFSCRERSLVEWDYH